MKCGRSRRLRRLVARHPEHEGDRPERERAREREDRRRAAEREEHAAEGRPGEHPDARDRVADDVRGRQLVGRCSRERAAAPPGQGRTRRRRSSRRPRGRRWRTGCRRRWRPPSSRRGMRSGRDPTRASPFGETSDRRGHRATGRRARRARSGRRRAGRPRGLRRRGTRRPEALPRTPRCRASSRPRRAGGHGLQGWRRPAGMPAAKRRSGPLRRRISGAVANLKGRWEDSSAQARLVS